MLCVAEALLDDGELGLSPYEHGHARSVCSTPVATTSVDDAEQLIHPARLGVGRRLWHYRIRPLVPVLALVLVLAVDVSTIGGSAQIQMEGSVG